MELDRNILVMVSDFLHEQTCNYVVAIEKQAASLGYRTTVFSMLQLSELFTNGEEFVYDMIDFEGYAGVILVARSFSAHKGLLGSLEKIIRNKCTIPVVSIGNTELDCEVVKEPSAEAFEKLGNHLIEEHNCERIYFLGGNKDDKAEARSKGYRDALSKHGLPAFKEWILYGGYWKEGAEKLARDISYGNIEKPDAVMCISDEIAFFLIENLFKVGLRVPEDILVTGFRKSAYSENNIIPITTVCEDEDLSGTFAVSALHQKITGEIVLVNRQRRFPMIKGVSCGCGVTNKQDVRLRLEAFGLENTKKMEYRNSAIKEKMFLVRDKADLVNKIRNLIYLVPNNNSVGIFTFVDDENTRCLFLTEVVEDERSIVFKRPGLFPEHMISENERNVHVFPLIFNGEKLGYMTVGYQDAHFSYKQTVEFAEIVSIALKFFDEKQNASGAKEVEGGMDEGRVLTDKKTYVLGEKDGIVSKINIDNIYYFEAIGKEVFAITKNNRYTIDQRLYECENKYEKQHFIRISKSMLINMGKVVAYKENDDRSITATLNSRETVRISRKYKDIFKENLID